jgi:glycosyltransferase involved in cell wall biosynthesis
MRIVLDLQAAQGGGQYRGIGRYALSFAQAIVRQRLDHEVMIALSDLSPQTIEPIRAAFDGLLPQASIRVWQAPGPVRSRDEANAWRRRAAIRIRAAFMASLHPDLVHESDPFGGFSDEVVATTDGMSLPFLRTVPVYDLIPLLQPGAYLAPSPRYETHYRAAVADAGRADGWLAISESSAAEAREHLAADPTSVVNVSAACDPMFQKLTVAATVEARVRSRHGLSRPFVMYSGGSDPRKNLLGLIRAYAGLPHDLRRAHQLLLVGKMSRSQATALLASASAVGLTEDDLRIVGYVEDDDLVVLYNLCALFVLPSTHEGFGLPALEAMSCGAAVIGGNRTGIPEVIGWADALFDPLDVNEMSSSIERALTNPQFRAELILRGREQAGRFSWDANARTAIAAFERFHGARAEGRASAARDPDDAVARLAREVAALPGQPGTQDLLGAARAISHNHPEPGEPRLLVDVSDLLQPDPGPGVGRLARETLERLPLVLPAGHAMQPVHATTDRPGYREVLVADHGDDRTALIASDNVVEPRQGDVFLGLGLHAAVPAQGAFYAELRRLGISVYFVVSAGGVDRQDHSWLQIAGSADGVLCSSRAIAEEFETWMAVLGPKRERPLRVGTWNDDRHPGTAGVSTGSGEERAAHLVDFVFGLATP